MKHPFLTSQRATRAAFGVVVVFLALQISWWMFFQYRYITRVTADTVSTWEKDAQTATALWRLEPELQARLLERYPNLTFSAEGFAVNNEKLLAFKESQASHLRMFAFETPFYGLVILAGLFVIWHSLRGERELKQRQQNFLNAISHEFKTPISALRLLVQTAQYRALNPDKLQVYLQKMAKEVDRLEHMSEQVLASARLEHGPLKQALETTDLNALVQQVLEKERGSLQTRGANLQVYYSHDTPWVSLDEGNFTLVLSNLLDNAMKYSPGCFKPIIVTIETEEHLALVHVEDAGIGISEREKKRIFTPFYRIGDEMTRRTSGVGLGLHLVRSLTESMNGWVRCESPCNPVLGCGTRFTLVFPKREGSRASTIANAPSERLAPQR